MQSTYLHIVSIVLSIATSCVAQNNLIMKDQNIILPQIDNVFETFDVKNFNKNEAYVIKKEGDFFIRRMPQSFGYGQQAFIETSYFNIAKLFFKNGFIKEKGISFNNGSEYGVWYQFNEAGELIQEIDTDAGYTYTWEEVIQYCHNHNIPLTKGYKASGSQTGIYKRKEDGKKVWVIEYLTAKEDDVYSVELTLDGTTGKEIKRREAIFDGH